MSEEVDKPIVSCNTCNKPKKQSSGSLTQWVFGDGYCECGREVVAAERNAFEQSSKTTVEFCSTCGKRKNTGRVGSLTQWIFRQESCQCGIEVQDSRATGFGSGSKPLDLVGSRAGSISGAQILEEPDADEELKTLTETDFPYARYKPLRSLGRGASGAVYKCYDRQLKRLVAIKVLNVLNADELVQFQNEARASAQLNRPGIVKTLDFGITGGGHPYMVMDFIDGTTLASYLKEVGVMSLDDSRYLASRIADALSTAHKHGIFHRDIKPSNVMVVSTIDGILKDVTLIDFGVAMFRKGDLGSSNPTLAGTPVYMSADQAEGITYDARSEIYSLGCLLYETLVGAPPFQADSALQLLNLHATAQPPAISEKRSDIPPDSELVLIIYKCLEKSPDDRFQSMDEFGEAIDEIEPLEMSSETQRVEVERNAVDPRPTFKFSTVHLVILIVSAGVLISVVIQISRPKASLRIESKGAFRDVRYNQRTFESVDKMVDFAEDLRDKHSVVGNPGATFQLDNGEIVLTNKYASDEFIQSIEVPTQLKQVSMTDGSVTGKGLSILCKGKSLAVLTLQELPNLKCEDVDSVLKANLDLNTVSFSGFKPSPSIFNSLGKLEEMRSVTFRYADLKGADLTDLANLPKLRSLLLRYCKVNNQQVEQILSIKTLVLVDLTGAYIDDAALLKLAQLPRLKVIFVAGCKNITADGLKAFSAAAPRCKVEFSLPYTTPQFCDYFYDDADLVDSVNSGKHTIDASDWSITDAGLGSLAGQPITHLSVSHTKITDKGFARIAKIQKLKSLMMNGMANITDGALLEVAKLPNLKKLSLNSGTFSDGAIAELCTRLANLEEIQANSTGVSSKTCRALSKKKTFDFISFENCHIRDSDLALLAKIPGLRGLFINGNTHLTKNGFSVLERCRSLTQLRVSAPADEETRRWLKERLPKCEVSLVTDARQFGGR